MRKFLLGMAALTALTAGIVFAASTMDVGPKADVAALRTTAQHASPYNKINGVHVVGDYALLQWDSQEASGQYVFKRVSGEQWKKIGGGGGAIGVDGLVQSGVPASVAHQLCSGWPKGRSPC